MKKNNQLIFRNGNVVPYTRDRIKYYQARIKLQNNKWKRISTGETDLKTASSIACKKYDEIKVLKKRNIAIDTRKFKVTRPPICMPEVGPLFTEPGSP